MIIAYWILSIIAFMLPNVGDMAVCGKVQIFIFLCAIDKYLEGELFFISLVIRYYIVCMLITGDISFYLHVPSAVVFFTFASWLHFRPEFNNLPHDKGNVLIAFYKGKKGSFKMKLYSLLDLNAKSACVVCDDKVLRMKNGIEYVYDSTGDAVRASSDYILYDTGVKATDALKERMAEYKGIVSRENWLFSRLPTWFYSDCLEIISPLLYNIRKDLPPTNWRETFPSVYLRKCLNYG